ncbi:hypothetical protein OAO87_01170 [bacterium]|nr:hypothetical protein [bacterium]
MNRFVIKRGWLKHAVDEAAQTATPSGCVPEGVTRLLFEPKNKSARPCKWITTPTGRSVPTSLETVTSTLDEIKAAGDVRTRDLEGYTSMHLAAFLQKVNHYALDEDDRKFLHCSEFRKQTLYPPMIWYVLHGHFCFVTSPDAVRSVSNDEGKPPPQASRSRKSEPDSTREVHLLDDVTELEAAITDGTVYTWSAGIWIVDVDSLDHQWELYMVTTRQEAKATLRGNGQVAEFEVQNGDTLLTFAAFSEHGAVPCETMLALSLDVGSTPQFSIA